MAETTLLELYNKHKKGDWPDKGSVHSYIEVYEELLKPYREKAINVLEVGLMSGESLRMWDEYFTGMVYGMDCDMKPVNGLADLTQAVADGLNVVIGDASKPADIAKFFTGYKFDVVIEDAGHEINQQVGIYWALQPYMAWDSIYIIEDVQSIENAYELKARVGGGKIIDRRSIKGRYDDILLVIK